jgi:hypothetical protein
MNWGGAFVFPGRNILHPGKWYRDFYTEELGDSSSKLMHKNKAAVIYHDRNFHKKAQSQMPVVKASSSARLGAYIGCSSILWRAARYKHRNTVTVEKNRIELV